MTILRWTEERLAEHVARNAKLRRERAKSGATAPDGGPVVPDAISKPKSAVAPILEGRGMVEFTVPGVPVPKGRPRLGKGHTYTPAKTIAAERVVASVAKLSGCIPLHGPLRVVLDFFLPLGYRWPKAKIAAALAGDVRPTGRPDADNLGKLILDGISEQAFAKSDAQVVELICRKFYALDPHTRVRIIPL